MNWSLLFQSIGAISSFLILVQLILSFVQKKKEHEEQRRQKTVEVLLEWNRSLERETSLAEKIVEKFNQEQCRKLYRQEKFFVDKETKKNLCQICSEKQCSNCDYKENCDKTEYEVSERQLLELRWYIISYLNTLETVLVAWQQGTVDRKVIEHEFSYLYSRENGWDVLSAFRDSAGGTKAYPVIEAFIFTLKENEARKNKLKIKYGL